MPRRGVPKRSVAKTSSSTNHSRGRRAAIQLSNRRSNGFRLAPGQRCTVMSNMQKNEWPTFYALQLSNLELFLSALSQITMPSSSASFGTPPSHYIESTQLVAPFNLSSGLATHNQRAVDTTMGLDNSVHPLPARPLASPSSVN